MLFWGGVGLTTGEFVISANPDAPEDHLATLEGMVRNKILTVAAGKTQTEAFFFLLFIFFFYA